MLVRDATTADRDAVAAMLARAFENDPAMRYIWPDPAVRGRGLVRLFALFFDTDVAGMRFLTDGVVGATLWRPPGRAKDHVGDVLRHLSRFLTAFGTAALRAINVGEAIAERFPAEPFWYLHIAGVEPDQQERGIGGCVIRAGLARCDAMGLPAYLETATEANVPIYAALGFRVTGEFVVPRSDLRFWSMWRPAA